MNTIKTYFNTPEHAKNYENKAKKSNWIIDKILLQQALPYIQSGKNLLDLGIGTGMTAQPFHEAGLHVYGIDFSKEMLNICKDKNFTEELQEHDLRNVPYPYKEKSMEIIVCTGVLHIFKNLDPIFGEVSRILHPQGIFLFTCADHNKARCAKEDGTIDKQSNRPFKLYQHTQATIEQYLSHHNFKLLDTSEIWVDTPNGKKRFTIYTAQNC